MLVTEPKVKKLVLPKKAKRYSISSVKTLKQVDLLSLFLDK